MNIDLLDRVYKTYMVVVGWKTPGWAPGKHSVDDFYR